MIAKTLIIQKGEPRVSGEIPPDNRGIENSWYKHQLDTFIKNSVVVGNVGDLVQHIYKLGDPELILSNWINIHEAITEKTDGFYPLPEGITYEVKEQFQILGNWYYADENWSTFSRMSEDVQRKVAILTFAPKDNGNNSTSPHDYDRRIGLPDHITLDKDKAQEKSAEEVPVFAKWKAILDRDNMSNVSNRRKSS
jgi:hypothetical protein